MMVHKVPLNQIASFPRDNIDPRQFDSLLYLDTGSITDGIIESYSVLNDLATVPSRARLSAQVGDIIYSSVRPINKHYGYLDKVPNNAVYSTGFTVIRVDPTLANPKFVYYLTLTEASAETS